MKVDFNGLRRNIANDYNRAVEALGSFIDDTLTGCDGILLHQELDEKLEDLRQDIAVLCCCHEDGNEDCAELLDVAKSLYRFR